MEDGNKVICSYYGRWYVLVTHFQVKQKQTKQKQYLQVRHSKDTAV